MPPHARWSLSLSWAKNSDKIEHPDSLSAGGAFRICSDYLTFPSDADLAITRTDLCDPVVVGAQVQYTLTVTNYGPSDATGVVCCQSAKVGHFGTEHIVVRGGVSAPCGPDCGLFGVGLSALAPPFCAVGSALSYHTGHQRVSRRL